MHEGLKFLISLLLLTSMIALAHVICKRKFRKDEDDWIGSSIIMSLTGIYVAVLITYMAQYKPAHLPVKDKKV